MPRNQVYGKRSHLYSFQSSFISPSKCQAKHEIVQVFEVEEQLARLSVKDESNDVDNVHKQNKRRPLSQRDDNIVLEMRRESSKEASSKTKRHEAVTPAPRQTTPGAVQLLDLAVAAKVSQPERPIISKQQELLSEVVEKTCPVADETIKEHLPLISISATDRDSTPATSNIFATHTSSLLQLSSQPMSSFTTWSDQITKHFAVTKIAEASFGEVYRLSLLRPHASLGKSDESVLKIIALKPPPPPSVGTKKPRKPSKAAQQRIDSMSSPIDVASEVRLLQRMTHVPGYTNFRDAHVLRGRPGTAFSTAWTAWNASQIARGKERSVFPDPSKKSRYSADQLWAVIEMQDAGTDLENARVDNVWLAWDVFWNVVLALGKGEEAARFEHRDLHLGNICVSSPMRGGAGGIESFDPRTVDVRRKLGFTGVETTLIDYTISRAEMAPTGPAQRIQSNKNGVFADEPEADVAFFDLESDTAIFDGDAAEEYQYEIYRHMRGAMYLDDPLADLSSPSRWAEAVASGRSWRGYHPQTNLVWLHFVLHQLSEQIVLASSGVAAESRDEAELARSHRAAELGAALRVVGKLLDPGALPGSGLRSAGDLVALALDRGWLDVEDVVGGGAEQSVKKVRGTRPRGRRARGKR